MLFSLPVAQFGRRLSHASAFTVFTVSLASMMAWIFGSSAVRDVMADEMNFYSAIALCFLSLSLGLAVQPNRVRERLKNLLLVVPFSLSSTALLAHSGVPQFNSWLGAISSFLLRSPDVLPRPMALISAISILLLSLAGTSLDAKPWRTRMAQRFAMIASCIGLFASLSFIGRSIGVSSVAPFTKMNPLSAFSVLIAAIGLLSARTHTGLMKSLTSTNPSGMFARRMMVAAFMFPPILGWVGLFMVEQNIFSNSTAWAALSLLSIILFATLVWQSADAMAKSEEAMSKQEMRFRSMANSIPQLAWMANKDGWIFWYNERWYDYTGTTLNEMEGWGWEKVHDPSQLKRATASWKLAIETGEPWEDKFPLLGKDGIFRWFLSRARPMRNDDGEIIFWFGTNTDIEEQFQTERELTESRDAAEKANQAKTQFLANMSHEIRTPIGAIMGFTDLLRNPANSDAEKASFMTVIERNSQNLLRLIDDILDLSKVEVGKIALEQNVFNLIDFLSDIKSVMGLKAAEKGIQFTLTFDGKIPDKISTDSLRLRQVLANVIGNAIKFTEAGSVTCVVRYRSPLLVFRVTDSGIGVSVEGQRNLFQAFSQADPSMTRRFGGTGLGLILSKKLSSALGGDVKLIKSEVGSGSVFEVSLTPLVDESAKLVDAQSLILTEGVVALKPEDKGKLSKLKVLVVDDAPDNRTLVSLYLNKSGAEVKVAVDGESAVLAALSEQPDVVLMDIQMPKMDGHSATKKLRDLGFAKPIIALTAHAMREERDKCFESGCTDYLTKPIQKDLLIEVLQRYLPKSANGTTNDY